MYVFVSFLVWQSYHIKRGAGFFVYFILVFMCETHTKLRMKEAKQLLFVCSLVRFPFVPIGLSVICDCVIL